MKKISGIGHVKNEGVFVESRKKGTSGMQYDERRQNGLLHLAQDVSSKTHNRRKDRARIRGIRRKQLLDDPRKERRYWNFNKEASTSSRSLQNSFWKRLWNCR